MRPGRYALAAGALVAAGAAALAATLLVLDGRPYLEAQFRLRTLLAPETVVRLRIEGATDVRMFLNPRDQVITPRMHATGAWEPVETVWLLRELRPGDEVVDVGANVGYYTLLAARRVGPTGHVTAFEPDPESFGLLERNVRLNGFANVTAEQKAASSEGGSLRLYLSRENRGDHRIYPTGERQPFVEVEAVRLDAYFAGRLDEIDLIKIDTQGAEDLIVQGLSGLFAANRDVRLAIEFWPEGLRGLGSDPATLLGRLVGQGFRLIDLGAGGAREHKVRPVEPEELLRTYTVENGKFTNLFLSRR